MGQLGIDVSFEQGENDVASWRELYSKGFRFTGIRCQEALEPVDAQFARNVAGAQMSGFCCFPYNPGHPDKDAEAQANAHFASAKGLGTKPGDGPPALDIELQNGKTWAEILAWTIAYMNYASLLWKRPIQIYSYRWFLQQMLASGDPTPLAASTLWLADYGMGESKAMAPWDTVLVQQTSGGNKMKMPNGCPVDADTFLGDDNAWALFRDPTAQIVVPLAVETT